MGKKLVFFISIIVLVVIAVIHLDLYLNKDKKQEQEQEDMRLVSYSSYVDGKIIEKVDDNNVVIEITQDVYPFKAGEKMKVRYGGALYSDVNLTVDLRVNDVISVLFFSNNIKKENGYYYQEAGEVYLVSGDESISGNILEVYDSKVLIEVDSGDEKEDGQKVMVEYKEYYESVDFEPKLSDQAPKVGDYVWILYSADSAVETEGEKNIKCKMLVHTN